MKVSDKVIAQNGVTYEVWVARYGNTAEINVHVLSVDGEKRDEWATLKSETSNSSEVTT